MTQDDFLKSLKASGVQPSQVPWLENRLGIEALKNILIQVGGIQSKEQWEAALVLARTQLLAAVEEEKKRGVAWDDIEGAL